MAAGIVESRPGSEDPAALALMDKLAAISRKRWPTDEMPSAWTLPGLVPEEGVPAVKPSPEQQQSVEPV